MKQHLPLLDLVTEIEMENEKETSRKEDILLPSYQSQAKNINLVRHKTLRSIKMSNDLKEISEPTNHLKFSIASNNINNINEYKELKPNPSNEERNNLILSPTKSGIMIASKNQLALKKLSEFEELKKKMDDIKLKKQETSEQLRLQKIRGKLEILVDSNIFIVFFMVLTIFIMFITDIQSGWLSSNSDGPIEYLQTAILLIFILEILITCLAKKGYTNSFFFWLDVVSTISIIQDIGFMFDPLLNLGSGTSSEVEFSMQIFDNSTDVSGVPNKGLKNVNAALGKITAVSRITRVLRIIRVIRLIRIVKLYKNAMLARENILKKRKLKEISKNSKRSSKEIKENENKFPANKLKHSRTEITQKRRDSKGKQFSGKNVIEINTDRDYIINNYEDDQNGGKIINNYVQITNIININENFNADSIMPAIEMKIDTNIQKKNSIFNNGKRSKTLAKPSSLSSEKHLNQISENEKDAKLLKNSSKISPSPQNPSPEKKPKKREEMSLENLMSESKTSKIVTEAITKKVIILILSILIMLPILDDSFYASDDTLSYNILSKYISNYLSIFSNDSIPNYLPPKLNNSLWDLVVNQKEEVFPIVNITAYQNIFYINSALANFEFRKSELSTAISPEGNVVIIFSLISDIKINALLNIIKTVCLCILVTVATIFFERDVKSLVLDPLEVMIEIVDKVSKDPIKAKNFDNLESGMKTTISKIQKEDQNNNSTKNKKKRLAKEGDEVKIIQSAIMKISALLAIGIGEAGNEIIKENLSNYNDLDPMVQGRKKNYIFGFCDIRGFPLVNEALQEQTMVFLNQIADIVHSSVDLFNGATNKNIGDAFLMVWKLPNDFQLEVFGNELMETPREVNAINKLNKRLILHSEKNEESGTENFLKINSYNSTINNKINFNNNNKNNLNNNNNLNNSNIINNNINYNNSDNNKYVYNNFNNNNDLNTNQNFLRINNEDYLTITKSSNNKALGIRSDAEAEPQQKISAEVRLIADSAVFGFLKVIAKINRNLRILAYRKNPEILAKIKDFKVNMGFGLHVGWAIEGAIGSAYKIDASYLSPNVNMAARLEGATRQYGVSILISGSVHDLLSPEVKSLCRLIDVVTVKGSTKPVKFYTIDLNENLKPSKHYKKDFTDKQRRLTQMVKKKKIKKESEETGLYAIMIKKKYFRVMFKNARPKFFNGVFKEAFGFYIKGDWASAAGKFRECLKIYQNDGPAKTLLKYILENNSLAPADWEGFRALTSK